MRIRVGINAMGRIGRAVLRDSTYGRWTVPVETAQRIVDLAARTLPEH